MTAQYFVLPEKADILAQRANRDAAVEKARQLGADEVEAEPAPPADLELGRPFGKVRHRWRYRWNAWSGIGEFLPEF